MCRVLLLVKDSCPRLQRYEAASRLLGVRAYGWRDCVGAGPQGPFPASATAEGAQLNGPPSPPTEGPPTG
jgi:hypothetical protein